METGSGYFPRLTAFYGQEYDLAIWIALSQSALEMFLNQGIAKRPETLSSTFSTIQEGARQSLRHWH